MTNRPTRMLRPGRGRAPGGARTAGCPGSPGRARASSRDRRTGAQAPAPGRARCPARSPRPDRPRPAAHRHRRSAGRAARCALRLRRDGRRRSIGRTGVPHRGRPGAKAPARLSRMHLTSAGLVAGIAWSRRLQAAAIRDGMPSGGRNDGSSGSMTGPPAGSAPAATRSDGRSSGLPSCSQVRSDSWSSHSPMTLRR